MSNYMPDLAYLQERYPMYAERGVNLKWYEACQGAEYENALRQAFDFLRKQGNGRHSPRTLQRLLSASDSAEARRMNGETLQGSDHPCVLTLGAPVIYDQETEVKQGGLLGTAAFLNDGDVRRVIISVARSARRQGYGRALLKATEWIFSNDTQVMLSNENDVGQHFLLANGFLPQTISSNGTVCYRLNPEPREEDLGEDTPRRGRRPLGNRQRTTF